MLKDHFLFVLEGFPFPERSHNLGQLSLQGPSLTAFSGELRLEKHWLSAVYETRVLVQPLSLHRALTLKMA